MDLDTLDGPNGCVPSFANGNPSLAQCWKEFITNSYSLRDAGKNYPERYADLVSDRKRTSCSPGRDMTVDGFHCLKGVNEFQNACIGHGLMPVNMVPPDVTDQSTRLAFYAFAKDVGGKAQPTVEAQILLTEQVWEGGDLTGGVREEVRLMCTASYKVQQVNGHDCFGLASIKDVKPEAPPEVPRFDGQDFDFDFPKLDVYGHQVLPTTTPTTPLPSTSSPEADSKGLEPWVVAGVVVLGAVLLGLCLRRRRRILEEQSLTEFEN